MSIDVDLFNQKLRDKDEEIARLLEENKKLRNDASTDILTNLPNRRQLLAFLDEFQSLFERGVIERYNVVAFDLDGFKPVNDKFGHSAGDACLRFIAEEVHRALRSSDFFAREGGDEFVIVLPGIKEDMAVRVAKKVLLVIEEGVNTRLRALLKSDDVHVSASFGVLSFCKDGGISKPTKEEILKLADYVRYVTKQNGKGGVLTLEQARTIDTNDAIWTNFKA